LGPAMMMIFLPFTIFLPSPFASRNGTKVFVQASLAQMIHPAKQLE
jgi:hypothetical protein